MWIKLHIAHHYSCMHYSVCIAMYADGAIIGKKLKLVLCTGKSNQPWFSIWVYSSIIYIWETKNLTRSGPHYHLTTYLWHLVFQALHSHLKTPHIRGNLWYGFREHILSSRVFVHTYHLHANTKRRLLSLQCCNMECNTCSHINVYWLPWEQKPVQ